MDVKQALLGAGVLGAGALFLVGGLQLSAEAGYAGVGPNFLPLLVGAMLALCGGWLVWEAATGGFRNMEEASGAARGDWVGFAWVSAGILANAALITTIGFILSCTLCFVLAARGFKWAQGARGVGLQAIAVDALIGVAISAPVFWMFTQLLAIGLPGLTSTGWI
ncbi:tripartite tricarboxylate transporter TctB family protein [Ideonella sp.]|uniref:tripartite tricarboxylate transporter TctB family protein n=1 Tax=Ideonella sp. TaxID=1929293 RepID=UPI002B4A8E95|nr:tripartite tricarboxylate transporter TctB family protein [Ideonella sp.]HJV72438.1 tripartite tricarboxylate transporter TctB family protein [Ideonella sp.]